MKVKDLKDILNEYKDNDDLYLIVRNDLGLTVKGAVTNNKVHEHYLHPKGDIVHLWLDYKENEGQTFK